MLAECHNSCMWRQMCGITCNYTGVCLVIKVITSLETQSSIETAARLPLTLLELGFHPASSKSIAVGECN